MILLTTIRQFDELSGLLNVDALKKFLAKLRPDGYPPAELARLNFEAQLENWLALSNESCRTFFGLQYMHNEPNTGHEDNWKTCRMFRCIALQTPDRKVHAFKTQIMEFSN